MALLHRLIEDQVDRDPDGVAVLTDTEALTYRELDDRANRVARFLLDRGIRPDGVVGVGMDRSAALVAVLLGVLKAGAAYLPLDLDAPTARNADLLQRAGSAVCLCDGPSDLPGALPLPDLSGLAPARPDVRIREDGLVSVYHTSGSTGPPKAVASVHRGWVGRMRWMQDAHDLRPGERVLQKTTLTFDDAAVEVFWPLIAGGTVVMLPPGLHRDPAAIRAATVRHRVAVLQFVPSWLAEFLDLPHGPGLESVRLVVSAGEPLQPELVRRFRRAFGPDCVLRNLWGLTETSIDSTAHTCGPEDEEGPVPIGTVIDGAEVHVLDDLLRPCPPGRPGELYIGGSGLARCYLGDPVRTAERFVASPFGTGERLYRTGDRGLRRDDGALMFLGRHDRQVKLRGIRVELSEIENALVRHPSVVNAAVVLARDPLGEPCLVAYVAGPAPAPREEFVAFLSRELPPYTIPSLFVPVAEMPKTSSGKTDRKSLPPPDWSARSAAAAYRPPSTPLEQALAELWAESLGVSRVGVDDDFFLIGGASVHATRLMAHVRSAFTVDIPLQELFDHPTIARFAPVVEAAVHAAVAAMSDADVASRIAEP
ncbi:non-ribosomal peptide synthetase [Spirillospora sp. NPDC046719]